MFHLSTYIRNDIEADHFLESATASCPKEVQKCTRPVFRDFFERVRFVLTPNEQNLICALGERLRSAPPEMARRGHPCHLMLEVVRFWGGSEQTSELRNTPPSPRPLLHTLASCTDWPPPNLGSSGGCLLYSSSFLAALWEIQALLSKQRGGFLMLRSRARLFFPP